jgi:predicted ABC-type ATPase
MTNNNSGKMAIFSMGLPGAGKSTVIGERFPGGLPVDPDTIKALHPDYDPKNPAALHAWSQEETERLWQATMADRSEDLVIVDGTGTNSDKMVRRIREAQAAGYHCRLVYVRVKLATAIFRNANRERVVPEQIIREKHRDIATAFEIVSGSADSTEIVDND